MTETANAPVPGRCLCGAARFTARPLEPVMHACHCSLCRKWSGGVFLAVPATDVRVEDDSALAVYGSSDWAERLFCKTCGSSLFWRMRSGGHYAVAVQSFDDLSPFVFAEEIFIDEKPASYAFAGDRPRKTGAEVMAEFAAAGET
jgi:hypothetical protein